MSGPVLWHLKVSHYNEKARWALDFKRVPHTRRALTPGVHPLVTRLLGAGETTPVLVSGGRAIGDSTRIIAELERRHPDPPLYPADPGARSRALALEDFFDEELGPYTRMLAMHHALPDPDLFIAMFMPDLGAGARALVRSVFPGLRSAVQREFDLLGDGPERALAKCRAAAERLKAEAGPSGYLVGDTFTVADLTLAALLAPPLAPEQFPYPQPQRGHPRFEPVRKALGEMGLLEWMREIYARHR
jgi:glutathione S-transferase